MEFDFGGETSTHSYRTEDVEDFIKSVHILEVGTYHVVVGNPPYITVKDKAENESYRKAYRELSQAVRSCRPLRGADLPACDSGERWLHGSDHC